jgi:hypothetical protein
MTSAGPTASGEAAAAIARHMHASGFKVRDIVELLGQFASIRASRVRAMLGIRRSTVAGRPREAGSELVLSEWQERGGGRARTNQ